VHRLGSRFAPQHRAVVGIAEPNYTISTNGDAFHTPGADKCPIRTAGILKDPDVLFMPEDGVAPRHAGISQDDVGRRIPAQPVVGSRLQSMIRLPGSHHQDRASPRRSGTQRRHVY
jgi:hypothetical protein